MTYFGVVLTVLFLVFSVNVFALPDCKLLKGVEKQKCEEQERAEIRALIEGTNRLLEDYHQKEQQWANQLDHSMRHIDNVNQILDNAIKK